MTALLIIVLWWAIGTASFIYWWTSEFDLTVCSGIGSLFAGSVGPIAFFIGWCIHGEARLPTVLMKARK